MGKRPISEKTKAKRQVTQQHLRAQCPICASPTVRKVIPYMDWNDGHILVISDVPVRECREYGHQFLHAGVARKIERLFDLDRQHLLQPRKMMNTPVVELSMAA